MCELLFHLNQRPLSFVSAPVIHPSGGPIDLDQTLGMRQSNRFATTSALRLDAGRSFGKRARRAKATNLADFPDRQHRFTGCGMALKAVPYSVCGTNATIHV
jgi:hypothetical protein